MTAENTSSAGRPMTLLRADAGPVVPPILIADDQPAIQELLCWTLKLAGYRPTGCAGRQAVLTWRGRIQGDGPTVLLLDLSLLCVTEATGFLRHLRARWRADGDMPPQIIVLTTSKQVQPELGMKERVLLNPFHVRDLLVLIQQVIQIASRSEEGFPCEKCCGVSDP